MGRTLDELGIRLVLANSPQAKGRVERLWGTFQSRLLLELRLAEAHTLEEANAALQVFLPRFNERFGVPPAQPGLAYRPLPPDVQLTNVLCLKYWRTVGADHTVRFAPYTFQILPDAMRASYARARVEVQERLDGTIAVVYQGQVLAVEKAPAGPLTLRARKDSTGSDPRPSHTNGAPPKPAAIHPGAGPCTEPR